MNRISRLAFRLREHTGHGRKSAVAQIVEMVSLVLRGHVNPSEYLRYGFSSADTSTADIACYLGTHTYWHEVQPKLTDPSWRQLLANKWFFHLHFENVVPLPRMCGCYHPQYGLTRRGRPLRSAEDVEQMILQESIAAMVVKPVDGTKGKGVRVLDVVEADGGVSVGTASESSMSVARFVDGLNQSGADDGSGWILEERLSQDDAMDSIAPYGTHTMRVVTIVDRDGEVHVPTAAIKMGGPGSRIDNVATGGVAAMIDVETGLVGTGYSEVTGERKLRGHPGTDGEFTGQEVPQWDRVLSTAERSARNTPGVLAVGWDMMLSGGQVFVIEGNDNWDIVGPQTGRPGFLEEPIGGILRGHGVDVSDSELPPIRIRKALEVLGIL